ncbi:uncharacterized protein LOC129573407 [Sitodiplosis mosellana]|uniref:uncharacterized protein LOC129573407 n=1 Tax=Sitodiplosis mosellana TaxID=263140 RepID=UPI002443EB61|nr:uncharacterized protein LOC129573407 [Sitodiplosis mosellana]
MDSEQTKGCCNCKVISTILGVVEILLSIGFGFIFGVSYAIFGDYQTAIVIFLICFLNLMASVIWLRGIGLEEIRFLLTAIVWFIASLGLWLLWMILDVISGVELDKTILVTTALIVISHISTVLCYIKLRNLIMGDEPEDRRANVSNAAELEECKGFNS